MGRVNNTQHVSTFSPHYSQNTRQLSILELEQATRNFSHNNIIGEDEFGFVYKGLLQDGSIVAIKRCLYALTRDFVLEVKYVMKCFFVLIYVLNLAFLSPRLQHCHI